MDNLFYIFIQVLFVLLIAPLVNGIIKKMKALSQKRKGAPICQMYYDLYKLFKKDIVISDVASWVFKAAPYIVFSVSLVAALFVPITTILPISDVIGNGIMFIYILALGRFFLTLAGLDTGSTFGGMGSSREGMISSLIEPSIIVSLFTVGLLSHSMSIPYMMYFSNYEIIPLTQPVYIVIFFAMMVSLLAETGRIPIDDPATHLELTMVHEAMILEYSGRYLALMEYGAAIKQLLLMTFIVNIFLPTDAFVGGAIWLSVGLYLLKIILLSVIVAIVEIKTVKLRLFSIPNLAILAFVLSLLGFASSFVLG